MYSNKNQIDFYKSCQNIKSYDSRSDNTHMMCFTAFPEIQLNLGMRDIRDIGDCQWATPTHPAAITHRHRAYISMWVPWNTHPGRMFLNISPVTTIPPLPRESPIPLVLGFNRNSAVEFCNQTVYLDIGPDKIYRIGSVMISNSEPNRQLVTS